MSLIPGFLKRFFWRYFRNELHGVACLAECEGRILLIRHRYGRKKIWTVPSGAKKPYEKAKPAAVREMWNLMGIDIRDAVEVRTVLTDHDHPDDIVHCFIVHLPEMDIDEDRDLIAEARWFPLNDVPPKLSLVAKVLIQKLKYETRYLICKDDPLNAICK
jgi:ADP-ribose pyrophosphatase YjhB (NUDIX family)